MKKISTFKASLLICCVFTALQLSAQNNSSAEQDFKKNQIGLSYNTFWQDPGFAAQPGLSLNYSRAITKHFVIGGEFKFRSQGYNLNFLSFTAPFSNSFLRNSRTNYFTALLNADFYFSKAFSGLYAGVGIGFEKVDDITNNIQSNSLPSYYYEAFIYGNIHAGFVQPVTKNLSLKGQLGYGIYNLGQSKFENNQIIKVKDFTTPIDLSIGVGFKF